MAVSGDIDGSVSIKRKSSKKYSIYYEVVPLSKVAKETRSMPSKFINKKGNFVTRAFIEYAKPLIGKLPEIGRLKKIKVSKK